MKLRCAECQCAPHQCAKESYIQCKNCTKTDCCCCISFHKQQTNGNRHLFSLFRYLGHVKGLYAAALGIEILCIAAAEIGENTGLYLFGFNPFGIVTAYAMGYALAGFTTFITILGRYNLSSSKQDMCSCCSVLEQDSNKGFIPNLSITFRNFAVGLKRLPSLYKQPSLGSILKTSLVILVTAESVCILTAETIDLIFYRYSILLSVPLALLAGAFTVVAPIAYRKVKSNNHQIVIELASEDL
jgi:hypothetical protein